MEKYKYEIKAPVLKSEFSIKNLVFDLGNVLVNFRPGDYLKRLGFSKVEIDELTKIIFLDPRWSEFDRGTILLDDYIRSLKNEYPEKKEAFDKIFHKEWCSDMLTEKENTTSALIELSNNYNIYILSNVSKTVLDYVKTLKFWKYVDSGSYSYELHFCKPESEIYQAFLNDNNLIPEECLFFDDKEENIKAAQKVGMNGIVFLNQDLNEIRKIIKEKEYLKQSSSERE